MNRDLETSEVGLNLIKEFESLELEAYLDPVGIPTIGFGTIKYPDGVRVQLGDRISEEDAEYFLSEDVRKFEQSIRNYVKVELNQNEFDALVSWTYNLGAHNLKTSTMLQKLNLGLYERVPEQMMRWVYARGKKFNGLIRRRRAEADLFSTPVVPYEESCIETYEDDSTDDNDWWPW